MSTTIRRISETGFYHIYARGVGGQIIYEDDIDHKAFLSTVARQLGKAGQDVEVIAWCLMDNHFHMLVRGDVDRIAQVMQVSLSSYARNFNKRYGRKGHLFQNRFGSQAIGSEEYFLQAVRYIHQNPLRSHIAATESYRWSSYREYISTPVLVNTELVLETLGSREAFVDFHRMLSTIELVEPGDSRGAIVAKIALETAIDELGVDTLHSIQSLSKAERNLCIARLRKRELTVRQISRLTGISRSVIQRIQ